MKPRPRIPANPRKRTSLLPGLLQFQKKLGKKYESVPTAGMIKEAGGSTGEPVPGRKQD